MRGVAATILALVLAAVLALPAIHFGWVTGPTLLNVGMGAVGLIGLLLIVKLPWDLYFDARNLVREQRESLARQIPVSDDDQAYARRMSRLLLVACVAFHVVTAVAIAGATYASGGQLGYTFAAAYLLSMCFRPLAVFYTHQRERFRIMLAHCKVPRDDALGIRERLTDLEDTTEQLREARIADQSTTEATLDRLRAEVAELRETVTRQERAFDAKVDRVCGEFSRSIERLTEDQELLRGMRAFVRLVKET
jgi:hypothetical protein